MGETLEKKQAGPREGKSNVSNRGADAESTDVKIERQMVELLRFHTELSRIDFERHRKKFNQHMSNSVSFLASAAQEIQKYLKDRAEKEIYGTEES